MDFIMLIPRVRGYKYELKLNNKERTLLQQCAGLKRFAWNWGFVQRQEKYTSNTGKDRYTSAITQHKELNILKKTEFTWMYNYSKCIPQEALRDLETAYTNFFREQASRKKKRAAGQKPGKQYFKFPKFKKKYRSKDSFRLDGQIRLFSSSKRVQIPRLGQLRLYERPKIPTLTPDHPSRKQRKKVLDALHDKKDQWNGRIQSATINREADRWFVSLQVKFLEPEPALNLQTTIAGFDAGEKNFGAYSNGSVEFLHPNPHWAKQAQRKSRKLHKAVSRKQKNSKNRKKAIKQLAKHYHNMKNQRMDHHHKLSNFYAKNHGVVVVESLNLSYFFKNKKQARYWADLAHGEFKRLLKYKCEWNGTEFVEVSRFFPSSKLCSNCHGYKKDLTLKDRVYTCEFCGLVLDRDINASRNLRWYYTVYYATYNNYTVANSLSETLNACGESIRPVTHSSDRHGSAKQEQNTKVDNFGLSNFG